MYRKALEMGVSLCWGTWGCPFTGNFDRKMQKGSGKGSISLCRSSVRGTWRGLLSWGSSRIWGGWFRGWA
jgi:hypothetical protein